MAEGVAKRMMDQTYWDAQFEFDPDYPDDVWTFSGARLDGMKSLHEELCAEARAVLAEDADKGFGAYGAADRLDDHEKEVWDTAQRYLADRLGLSLTEPHSARKGADDA